MSYKGLQDRTGCDFPTIEFCSNIFPWPHQLPCCNAEAAPPESLHCSAGVKRLIFDLYWLTKQRDVNTCWGKDVVQTSGHEVGWIQTRNEHMTCLYSIFYSSWASGEAIQLYRTEPEASLSSYTQGLSLYFSTSVCVCVYWTSVPLCVCGHTPWNYL